jgi:hypothetical protein
MEPPFAGYRHRHANRHYRLIVWAATRRIERPTGVGRAITTYTIPIEGRDEWEAAAERELHA